VLKRLGASPLTRPQFLAAKAVAVAMVVTVQVAVLLGVAGALGWRIGPELGAPVPAIEYCEVLLGCSGPGQPVLWLLPVGVVLGAAVFTALGLALAGALRAELVLAGSNAVYLVLVALSDLVFELPDAAAPFVVLTPSGALGIVLRRALDGPTTASALLALLVLAAWGLFAVAVASRTFRWEP
jgi:ABC-2 type transport system permease protein